MIDDEGRGICYCEILFVLSFFLLSCISVERWDVYLCVSRSGTGSTPGASVRAGTDTPYECSCSSC